MVDAWSPDEVVAFAFEGEAAFGEVDPELAADMEDQGCPLVIGSPFDAFLARRVDAPLISTSLLDRTPSAGSMKWPRIQPRCSRPSSSAFPLYQLPLKR